MSHQPKLAIRTSTLAVLCGVTLVAVADEPASGAAIPLPTLLAGLHHTDPRVRASAACAIGDWGAQAETAVPSLRRGLRDADPRVRWSCAIALGKAGRSAKAAQPDLVKALKDSHWTVRHAAALALAWMKPEPASITGLQQALDDVSSDVRRAAFFALQQVSKNEPSAAVAAAKPKP
jgi:HEAT repeat protein